MLHLFGRLSFVFMLTISCLALANDTSTKPQWTYNDQANWHDLSDESSTCASGKQQSPVNINSPEEVSFSLLQTSYQKATVHVFNNGHTIQVDVPEGNSLSLDKDTYQLVQLHFHVPSEHLINGKSYPMEMHLVHQNSEGKLAVLGVMFEEGEGNPTIQRIWDYIPSQTGKDNSRDLLLNISNLIPTNKSYYSYMGSLTTPPCSENVGWLVMQGTNIISAAQIEQFIENVGMNARDIQPLNDRTISKIE